MFGTRFTGNRAFATFRDLPCFRNRRRAPRAATRGIRAGAAALTACATCGARRPRSASPPPACLPDVSPQLACGSGAAFFAMKARRFAASEVPQASLPSSPPAQRLAPEPAALPRVPSPPRPQAPAGGGARSARIGHRRFRVRCRLHRRRRSGRRCLRKKLPPGERAQQERARRSAHTLQIGVGSSDVSAYSVPFDSTRPMLHPDELTAALRAHVGGTTARCSASPSSRSSPPRCSGSRFTASRIGSRSSPSPRARRRGRDPCRLSTRLPARGGRIAGRRMAASLAQSRSACHRTKNRSPAILLDFLLAIPRATLAIWGNLSAWQRLSDAELQPRRRPHRASRAGPAHPDSKRAALHSRRLMRARKSSSRCSSFTSSKCAAMRTFTGCTSHRSARTRSKR